MVDERDPEHASRRQAWYMSAAGLHVVPGAFQGILRKVRFESFVKNVCLLTDHVFEGCSSQRTKGISLSVFIS